MQIRMTEAEHTNRSREWRLKNADKMYTPTKCACGAFYTYANKCQHHRSQKHKRYETYMIEIETMRKQVEELSQTRCTTSQL
jgi:hypothetical protein